MSLSRPGRADLVRALAYGPEHRAQLAEILGYEFDPKDADSQSSGKTSSSSISGKTSSLYNAQPDLQQTFRRTAFQPESQAFWQPVRSRLHTPSQDDPTIGEVATTTVAAGSGSRRSQVQQRIPYDVLAPLSGLLSQLRCLTELERPGGRPDIRRLIDDFCRGRLRSDVPRLPRRGLGCCLHVVQDRSPHLTPYDIDNGILSAELKDRMPRTGLTVSTVRDGDLKPEVHWPKTDGGGSPESLTAPEADSVVLALTDLGALHAHGEPLIGAWQRYGEWLANRHVGRVALVPCGVELIPAELHRVWKVLPWQGSYRPARHLEQHQREAMATQLLALLSFAVTIEPRLLRLVRCSVPELRPYPELESLVWQHVALLGAAREGVAIDQTHRDSLDRFRKNRPPEERLTAIEYTVAEHAGHFEGLRHVEVLNLGREYFSEDEIEIASAWFQGIDDIDPPTEPDRLDRLEFARVIAPHCTSGAFKRCPALNRIWSRHLKKQRHEGVRVTVRHGTTGFEFIRRETQPTAQLSGSPMADLHLQDGRIDLLPGGDDDTDFASARHFWANGKAPSWASEWGIDQFGLWADFQVSGVVTGGQVFPAISDKLTTRQVQICEAIREAWQETGQGMSVDDIGGRFAVSRRFGLSRDLGALTDRMLVKWAGNPMNSLLLPVLSAGESTGRLVTQRLRWIPEGKFVMGSPEDEPGRYEDEGPQREVTITRGFWMFDTPCTQAFYQAVKGENPSEFKSPDRPVETVSWEDAQQFLKQLRSLESGIEIGLPTEAEWEYACRAGTTEALFTGPIQIIGSNNAPELDPIAWYGGNCGVDFDLPNGIDANWSEKQVEFAKGATRRVRKKAANPWGLYDMLGNVHEWCQDTADMKAYERGATTDPLVEASEASAVRVIRGGGWSSSAQGVRAAYRSWHSPELRGSNLGFRCRVRGAKPSQGAVEQARTQPKAGEGGSSERAVSGRSERSRGDSSPASGERPSTSGPVVEQTTWIEVIDRQEACIPVPQGPVARIVSDVEELKLRRMVRPDWASAIGRDEFGLWADLKVMTRESSSNSEVTASALSVRLRWIPPGRFMMGSLKEEPGRWEGEFVAHPVVIPDGFWLFETPVTQRLWKLVMGEDSNKSEFQGADRPVERVTWHDCGKFCSELSDRTGLEVTLSSEAEWEYACRAGATEATYAGAFEGDSTTQAVLDSIAWYRGNSDVEFELDGEKGTHTVGGKAPNPWGLCDMLGNVYEWCSDVWRMPGDSATDEVDEASASRVIRGGSWDSDAQSVRAAYRGWHSPGYRDYYLGFRCRVREFKLREESSDSVSAERRSP